MALDGSKLCVTSIDPIKWAVRQIPWQIFLLGNKVPHEPLPAQVEALYATQLSPKKNQNLQPVNLRPRMNQFVVCISQSS
jgi:hypothetical protein